MTESTYNQERDGARLLVSSPSHVIHRHSDPVECQTCVSARRDPEFEPSVASQAGAGGRQKVRGLGAATVRLGQLVRDVLYTSAEPAQQSRPRRLPRAAVVLRVRGVVSRHVYELFLKLVYYQNVPEGGQGDGDQHGGDAAAD